MKRVLLGLGCSLTISGGLLAQDASPAARLGRPGESIIRAQSPELRPAASFEVPKTMPKGAVTETAADPKGPPALPMPGMAPAPTPGATVVPPGATMTGPVLTTPYVGGPVPPGPPVPVGPPVYGEPFYPSLPAVPGYESDPTNWYVGLEALMVWVKAYRVPPLVTTGPTFSGAFVGGANTQINFGTQEIADNARFGARLTLGRWFSPYWAVELSGFYTRSYDDVWSISSQDVGGDLARPFFDINNSVESSEIVGRPGVVSGYIDIRTRGYLSGAEINARNRWWNDSENRLDLLAGVRYLFLGDEIEIFEQSIGLAGAGPQLGIERAVTDRFTTYNHFLGLQVGAIYQRVYGPWTIELKGKLAAGITRQEARIGGSTAALQGGQLPDMPGGLLALNTNIGERYRNEFTVVPEIGINVGYDITPRLRVFAGYSLLYWGAVVRPGGQIDRQLDVNLIPDFPAAPQATAFRPAVNNDDQSIWVQGANFGFIFKW